MSAGAACNGVTIAVNGTTHLVTSALELGHTFHGIRTPCKDSRSAKSAMASTQTDHTRKLVFSRARARSVSLCVCLFHTLRDAILKLSGRSACVEREKDPNKHCARQRPVLLSTTPAHCSAHVASMGDDAGRARG